MSKRSEQFIDPFPADIDRDYFGAWLSGFVDGEGCFCLIQSKYNITKHYYDMAAGFQIALRKDDTPVLKIIQSFFGCGIISYLETTNTYVLNAKPRATYSIRRNSDIVEMVIPHFQNYPLLAKKRNDFLIWKEAVELIASVRMRRQPRRGRRGGRITKWTEAERRQFDSLVAQLKANRLYKNTAVDPVSNGNPPEDDETPFDTGFLPGF